MMAASTTNTLVCFCFILFCRFGRIRGSGTFLAITMFNTSTRDKVIYEMRQRGVELGGCGAFSIRLRPSMVFTPDHAAEFLRIFDEVSERSEPRAKRAASEASRERSEPRAKRAASEASRERSEPRAKRAASEAS